MLKKILSIAIVALIVLSMTVMAVSAKQVEIVSQGAGEEIVAQGADESSIASQGADSSEASTGANTISFDVKSAGWNNVTSVFCHVWACDGTGDWPSWQSKKEKCDYDASSGVATYDLSKTGNDIGSGPNWACIFSCDTGMQTYDLLLGSECFGDTASCDRTTYESPTDSTKTAQAAFWKNQNKSQFGPLLAVTSIGNVVGISCPGTTTPYEMMVNFLKDTLENARTYSGKDDKSIVNDVGKGLGLSEDEIALAIEESGVSIDWEKPKITVFFIDYLDWGRVNAVYSSKKQAYVFEAMNEEFVNKDGKKVFSVQIPNDSNSVYFCYGNNSEVTEEYINDIYDGMAFYSKNKTNKYREYLLNVDTSFKISFIIGDADMNGIVSINDVTSIQRMLAGLTLKAFDSYSSDVDKNGIVNISDATIIQKYLAGFEIKYRIG